MRHARLGRAFVVFGRGILFCKVQLSQHLSEEFVQDVLCVFAAEVALDNQRERE